MRVASLPVGRRAQGRMLPALAALSSHLLAAGRCGKPAMRGRLRQGPLDPRSACPSARDQPPHHDATPCWTRRGRVPCALPRRSGAGRPVEWIDRLAREAPCRATGCRHGRSLLQGRPSGSDVEGENSCLRAYGCKRRRVTVRRDLQPAAVRLLRRGYRRRRTAAAAYGRPHHHALVVVSSAELLRLEAGFV